MRFRGVSAICYDLSDEIASWTSRRAHDFRQWRIRLRSGGDGGGGEGRSIREIRARNLCTYDSAVKDLRRNVARRSAVHPRYYFFFFYSQLNARRDAAA